MGHHWGQIPSVFCNVTAVHNQQAWTLRLKLMTVVLSGQEEKMRSHWSSSYFMQTRLSRDTLCGATRWRPKLSDPTQQSSSHNNTPKDIFIYIILQQSVTSHYWTRHHPTVALTSCSGKTVSNSGYCVLDSMVIKRQHHHVLYWLVLFVWLNYWLNYFCFYL